MFNIFQHNHIFDCNFIAHSGGIILYIFMGYALLLLTLQETHLVAAWMSFKPECEIRPINWWMTIATTVSWPDGTSHIRPISWNIPWSDWYSCLYSSPRILPRSSNENLEFIHPIRCDEICRAGAGRDIQHSRPKPVISPVGEVSLLRFTSLYLAKWP